ncbi:hypothetical protein SprV_0100231100 [Sparganum proliferum]
MHPRSRHRHLLDYVLVRRRDQRDMLVRESIPGANGWTDHRLVISKMRIRLRHRWRPQGKRPPSRAHRPHQDWFDDNDVAISNLPAQKNRLNKAYVSRPTDDNKATFYRSRCLVQQRLREMKDACTGRKAEEIQGYTDRNELKNFSTIKAVYGPPTKVTAAISATEVPYSSRRHKSYSNGPSTSETSSTALPPSPMLPSPVYLK